MTIRPAAPEDARAIAELLADLGYPTSAEEAAARLGRHGEQVLLAEAEGRVLGLLALGVGAMLQHAGPLARVNSLVVRRSGRGRGVGRALMARAEALALTAGCEGVELTSAIRPGREAAHRFYQALGYERTSYRYWRSLG